MASKFDKRVEAVEQAIDKISQPEQEAEIKAYCEAHNLNYLPDKEILVVSWPGLGEDLQRHWGLNDTEARQHVEALEALGCKRVAYIEIVWPEETPPVIDNQYGKVYVGWSPDNWDEPIDDEAENN